MFGLNQGSIYSILTIIFLSYYTREKVYPIVIKFYNDVNFFRLFTMIMSSQEMNEILEEEDEKGLKDKISKWINEILEDQSDETESEA